MQFITWSVVRSCFKMSCFVALCSMTSYWFYKFVIEDEDVCLVDYKPAEEADDFLLPKWSLCFENPFIEEKLKGVIPDINTTTYLKYLRGEIFDERFGDIDYENITLNLSDYYINNIVYWKNGTVSSNTQNNNVVGRMHVTSNGFRASWFYKCFGIEIMNKYRKDIKYVATVYKQNEFLDGFKRSSGNSLVIAFHYPSHFLLLDSNYDQFLDNRSNRTNYSIGSEIKGLEILNRRDKRKQRCLEDVSNYDGLVLRAHIKNNGCRAPYQQSFENFPICSTQKGMQQSVYEMTSLKRKYYPLPCKTISSVNAHTIKFEENQSGGLFTFWIGYTDQIKTITQIRAVNIHGFIGNIGGYIGLFLGYALIQLPELLVVVYRLLKKTFTNGNMSISDVSTVRAQNNIKLTPIPYLAARLDTNDVRGDTSTRITRRITMRNRVDRHEVSIAKLAQTIGAVALKLQLHDDLINKNIKK